MLVTSFDSVGIVLGILSTIRRFKLDEISGIGIDVGDVPISKEFRVIVWGWTLSRTRVEFNRFIVD
jgi:hypothetical protein